MRMRLSKLYTLCDVRFIVVSPLIERKAQYIIKIAVHVEK